MKISSNNQGVKAMHEHEDIEELEDELAEFERELYETIKFLILKRESSFLREREFQPPVDMYVCKDWIKIEMELAGVKRENIEITYINPLLHIKGVKKDPLSNRDVKYHCMECRFGSFQRMIEIPYPVDIDKARAELKDGVLSVLLPRIVDRRRKKHRIPIT